MDHLLKNGTNYGDIKRFWFLFVRMRNNGIQTILKHDVTIHNMTQISIYRHFLLSLTARFIHCYSKYRMMT